MKKHKGWIIYPNTKCNMTQSSYQWIECEAAKAGLSLRVLFAEELSPIISNNGFGMLNGGEMLDNRIDFAIVRGYDFVIIKQLEMMGIRVFNGHDAMYNSLDKAITHQLLAQSNIPTPLTLHNCTLYDVNLSIFGEKFIAKYPKGSRGREVYMIEDRSQFESVVEQFDQIITQEIIHSSYGKDIRVWVVGDESVAAVMRYNNNDFKSNYSLGGSVEKVEINDEIAELAVKSCKAIGLEFAGVDLLFTESGYCVCEVNGNAAFRSLQNFNEESIITHKLFTYIKNNIC